MTNKTMSVGTAPSNGTLFSGSTKATCTGYPTQTDITLSLGCTVILVVAFVGACIKNRTPLTVELFGIATIISGIVGTSLSIIPFVVTKC